MNITLALLGLVVVLVVSPGLAYLSMPWSPWWIGQQQAVPITVPIGNGVVDVPSIDVPAPPAVSGARVTDAERFQLIRAAGAPVSVAIIMTALSIAEDGSGDPSIVSKPNVGLAAGTVDIGILQINSAHIGSCGIQSKQWLFDPLNNARAAMCILGPGLNYCAWSTYEVSCGPGHTSAYRQYVAGATLLAEGVAWQH